MNECEKFSYSKLNSYKNCPFCYKLQYVDGNYIYVGNIATEFGSEIHKCEEKIATQLKNNLPIDYRELRNNLILSLLKIESKYKSEYFLDDGKSNRNYRDKAYEYLTSGIYQLEKFMKEHPTYEIVGIEQKFSFVYLDKYLFTGAIDRVFHDKATDRYIIQDIKSWAEPAKKDDLVTPLQFVIYSLAAEQLWKTTREQITCEYYLPLVNNGLAQSAGTSGFMTRGTKKIDSLFEKIESLNYTPNPSKLCHWCNFCKTNPNAPEKSKYLCPYFMNWTRESNDFSKEFEWQGLEKHTQILEDYFKKYNINITQITAEDSK